MRISSAESTDLFTGPLDAPLQVVRVGYTGAAGPTVVRIDGEELSGEARTTTAGGTLEVSVAVQHPAVRMVLLAPGDGHGVRPDGSGLG